MKTKLLVLFTVCLAITRFWYQFRLFFVQDEWFVFGTFLAQGWHVVFSGFTLDHLGHFVPLSKLLSLIVYKLFGVSALPYTILGFLVHLANVGLVFRLGRRYLPSSLWAWAASILFLTSAVGYEQISWPMVSINALALTFSLLAWDRTFAPLSIKSSMLITLYLALAIFIVENSLPMLVFVPLVLALNHLMHKRQLLLAFIPLGCLIGCYLLLRIPGLGHSQTQTASLPLSQRLSRVVTLPIQYVAQTFIPQHFMLTPLSKVVSLGVSDPGQAERIAQGPLFSTYMVILGSLIILLLLKLSPRHCRQVTLLCLIFIFLSSLPLLAVPGSANSFIVFPVRYAYFGLCASCLLTAHFFSQFSRKHGLQLISVVVVFNLFLSLQITRQLYQTSSVRKSILDQITSHLPALPSQAVILTLSDSPFYGLPEEQKIMPFQSGFGQTLLVWYSRTQTIPPALFDHRFLWEITDQGYYHSDSFSYGYYRTLPDLTTAYTTYHFPIESITAFSYDAKSYKITDITSQIRQSLAHVQAN